MQKTESFHNATHVKMETAVLEVNCKYLIHLETEALTKYTHRHGYPAAFSDDILRMREQEVEIWCKPNWLGSNQAKASRESQRRRLGRRKTDKNFIPE